MGWGGRASTCACTTILCKPLIHLSVPSIVYSLRHLVTVMHGSCTCGGTSTTVAWKIPRRASRLAGIRVSASLSTCPPPHRQLRLFADQAALAQRRHKGGLKGGLRLSSSCADGDLEMCISAERQVVARWYTKYK